MFTECILGLPGCGTEAPCPFHEEWTPVREQLKETFATTNIRYLVKKLEMGKRLS